MSNASTSSRRSLSPFWLLAILSGLNLFNYLDRYVTFAVVEPIRLSFGLNDAQAGRLNTAFMLGFTAAFTRLVTSSVLTCTFNSRSTHFISSSRFFA